MIKLQDIDLTKFPDSYITLQTKLGEISVTSGGLILLHEQPDKTVFPKVLIKGAFVTVETLIKENRI